jgi:hypothetical protein
MHSAGGGKELFGGEIEGSHEFNIPPTVTTSFWGQTPIFILDLRHSKQHPWEPPRQLQSIPLGPLRAAVIKLPDQPAVIREAIYMWCAIVKEICLCKLMNA